MQRLCNYTKYRPRKGEREKGRVRETEREGPICYPTYAFVIDSYVFSDGGLNPKPWHIEMMLSPSALPGQGLLQILKKETVTPEWDTCYGLNGVPLDFTCWSSDPHCGHP